MSKRVFFIFLLVHQLISTDAMTVEIVKQCCNLGTNHSLAGNACQKYPMSIPNVSKDEVPQCLRSADICCKRKESSLLCEDGENSAQSQEVCDTFDGIKKTCCESCLFGKETYNTNPDCTDTFSLGPSYIKCCKLAAKSTSTSRTTTTTSFKTTTPMSSKTSENLPPIENLCEVEGICAQICIPTGESYKCACNKGFSLMADKISCRADKKNKKIPNRCDVNNSCEQECEDTGVAIKCSCKDGYELDDDKTSCKDIDECALGIHDCTKNEICVNELGDYYCEDPSFTDIPIDFDKKCPTGYKFNGEKSSCDDIDECEINLLCPPPKKCKNTMGSYLCESQPINCPPGFYFKNATESCADIDECVTGQNTCNKESQICINTKGNYSCVEKVAKKTCPAGFRNNPYTQLCDDIDECAGDRADLLCASNEQCVNEEGSYTCVPKGTPFTSPTTTTTKKPTTTKPFSCSKGFTLSHDKRSCIDINECQLGTHTCAETQRCDNSPGSYHCVRTAGCGTGYTYNHANELCEDDDECALGTHNCGGLGSGFKCRNTLGSYRCDPIRRTRPIITTTTRKTTSRFDIWYSNVTTEPTIISGERKKCLPGYKMNSKGDCEDIDECENNPCGRGESCLNLHGKYQCTTKIQCRAGYDLNEAGDDCEDVNECVRGTHKCNPTQICRNGEGYYTCECPPGHHLNPQSNQCEDINECLYYRVCNRNSKCINTVGSYRCECKEGSKDNGDGCEDIDECITIPNICDHKCVNTPGSFRCACRSGFTLNPDNRTCSDVNECERFKDIKLCIGPCENIPGSYRCTCPDGYRLGRDGRTCQDIDECSLSRNTCPKQTDICVNIRGSYKCYSIDCPANYIRDRAHISRCKRPQNLCDPRDHECLIKPEQYTYHFIALVSNLPLNQLNLFTIQGPKFPRTRAEFNYRIVNVNCPLNVPRINSNYFRKDVTGFNAMKIYLTKSITGPQEAELEVEMKLFDDNQLHMSAMSRIFIIVSEFPY